MAPRILVDLETIDLERVLFPIEEIRKVNPQRFEFEQLTAIHHCDPETLTAVGSREIRDDEFWVRGHLPGNPLLPGVLMIEAAAQLCSFFQSKYFGSDSFFAFGGLEAVRFRSVVRPGDRLILIAKGKSVRERRSIFACQGVVGRKLAFEGDVIGVRMR